MRHTLVDFNALCSFQKKLTQVEYFTICNVLYTDGCSFDLSATIIRLLLTVVS